MFPMCRRHVWKDPLWVQSKQILFACMFAKAPETSTKMMGHAPTILMTFTVLRCFLWEYIVCCGESILRSVYSWIIVIFYKIYKSGFSKKYLTWSNSSKTNILARRLFHNEMTQFLKVTPSIEHFCSCRALKFTILFGRIIGGEYEVADLEEIRQPLATLRYGKRLPSPKCWFALRYPGVIAVVLSQQIIGSCAVSFLVQDQYWNALISGFLQAVFICRTKLVHATPFVEVANMEHGFQQTNRFHCSEIKLKSFWTPLGASFPRILISSLHRWHAYRWCSL